MSIQTNLESVRKRIEAACQTVGREPASVTLIAVSKTQTVEAIREAYEAGQRHFGESRLQEALPKIEALPKDIVWHFIGTLQSNKARRIASLFPFVHTFCSESQLIEAEKAKTPVEGFIEVNIADEPQKSGVTLEMLDGFHAKLLQSTYVHFCGLMMIGPVNIRPEQMSSYFKELKLFSDRYNSSSISMGMSGDFEVAVMDGATHVRVGTAIFGSRTK